MKAKLIKGKEHFSLQMYDKDILALNITIATIGLNKDTSIVASTSDKAPLLRLSLKNCQAIENGYDLDGLAKEFSKSIWGNDDENIGYGSYYEGFQKALEILGDKKYTEEDLKQALFLRDDYLKEDKSDAEIIQSLQPKEWDVEVCCYVDNANGWLDADSFNSPMLTNTGIPKLDADNCLILKRIEL